MKIVRAKLIFQSKDTLLFKTMTVIIILKKGRRIRRSKAIHVQEGHKSRKDLSD
jgi:hypothetical protein